MPKNFLRATSNPLFVFANFLAAALSMTSCVSSNESDKSAASHKGSKEGTTAQKKPETKLSDELIHQLPESLAAADEFEDSKIGVRLFNVMGRSLTKSDKQTLVSLRALLVSQRELREQRLPQARELAKVVLATENLSTEIYTSALRKLALTDVLELTASAQQGQNTLAARDPRSEFNAFQNLQCATVCKTPGWEILSREEPSTLGVSGYRSKLLNEVHFRREGLVMPQWLRNIWSQSASFPRKEIVVESELSRPETSLERVLKLRSLVDARQWNLAAPLAKKIITERKTKSGGTTKQKPTCTADVLFSQYVLAQNSRIQQERKSFAAAQAQLMESLEHSSCHAEDFGFDKEQFDSFKLDSRLWLARLQWEQNENPQAFHSARRALTEAAAAQSWEHYFDAAKILIGRIGFEMLNPTENIAFLNSLERQTFNSDSDEFPAWLNTRKGLLHFLEGDFGSSQKSFEKVIESTSDNFTRSMAFYWMGRTTRANNNVAESENSFLSAGRTDPLSIYDILSGQILARESGRASTQAKRAFINNWRDVYDSWMKLSDEKPLQIIASVPPRTAQNSKSTFGVELSQKQFDISLESAILIFSILRVMEPELKQDDFLRRIRDSEELLAHLLRAETSNLRQSFTRLNTLHSDVLPRAHQIAWLTHALGDHANSILFVGRLRDSLGWDTDYLPFLYFIFYPRPFASEFQKAASRCSVDVDILYSVARQESLFQSSVKSPVGAVGLMQLLPSTAQRVLKQLPEFQNGQRIDLTDPSTNTLAGACYLRDLLARYQNNLAHAVAAYNAGENAVDKWIARRQKIADVPYFIEFIPFAETKTYVQRVLRNYYNVKWIYQDPQPN
jgi:tetratricopeptide (TPR) repeat protein